MLILTIIPRLYHGEVYDFNNSHLYAEKAYLSLWLYAINPQDSSEIKLKFYSLSLPSLTPIIISKLSLHS